MLAVWCCILVIQVVSCQNLTVSGLDGLADIDNVTVPSQTVICTDKTGNVAHQCGENIDLTSTVSSNWSLQDSLYTQCVQNMTKTVPANTNKTSTYNTCRGIFSKRSDSSNDTQWPPLSHIIGYLPMDHYLANWYALYIIDPLIGIPGLFGNIASIIVMIKSGLHKPPNIFILALAVADFCALIANINFVQFLKYAPGKVPDQYVIWEFPYVPFLIMWYLDTFVVTLSEYGLTMTTMITVVIAGERCLAVFVPLIFTQIVTPRRAWITLACITIFWFPYHMLLALSYTPYHAYDPYYDTYIGWHEPSDNVAVEIIKVLNTDVIPHLTHTIPFILTLFASFAIILKVSLTIRKRTNMVSSGQGRRSSSRTTKTLLMVCVVFIVLQVSYILEYIPALSGRWSPFTVGKLIYYQIRRSLFHLKSAINFLIYILFNPKFREVFIETFVPACLRQRKTSKMRQA